MWAACVVFVCEVFPHRALCLSPSQLASVILKQYVETHWCAQSERFRPPETTERVRTVHDPRCGCEGPTWVGGGRPHSQTAWRSRKTHSKGERPVALRAVGWPVTRPVLPVTSRDVLETPSAF